ncbi:substrate-binding domain-containing protein [Puniceicoccus vermicola]|uniref:LacI family DNA-binding transcriptional regulator n=1 Tax=Puniceicoccus vermicola TaxID=388746 RepID=A0A7X1E4J7_9BACT|nr:LacI family DNA-binding transcriptional regulator [Puniceicoccus vermicola]
MSISQTAIAQKVGVSRSAVSHVLNGRSHMVGPELREKIMEAVEASGYHRNALVKALRSNRTHVIGIIMPELKVSYFSDMIGTIESEARKLGLQCFICQSHSSPEILEKEVVALREYRVDGLIIAPANSNEPVDVYAMLEQQKYPYVLLDLNIKGLSCSGVGNSNGAIGRLATEHLLELGHQRIAYLKGYPGPSSDQRYQGYVRALARAGVELDENLVLGGQYLFEAGVESVRSLVEKGESFTAIVASSDAVALGAIQELQQHGMRVPDDISVVGCGNLDLSRMSTPPLTTVDQRPEVIAERAVRLLDSRIQDRETPHQYLRVEPRMIVRQSTRKI